GAGDADCPAGAATGPGHAHLDAKPAAFAGADRAVLRHDRDAHRPEGNWRGRPPGETRGRIAQGTTGRARSLPFRFDDDVSGTRVAGRRGPALDYSSVGASSLTRTANFSSTTTTSPRAISRPLSVTSTGSPTSRCSSTTEPTCSPRMSLICMRVVPSVATTSTSTLCRRRMLSLSTSASDCEVLEW